MKFLLGIFVFFILTGCASIVADKTQPIMVLAICTGTNEPAPATCTIENDQSKKTIISPAMVSMPRSGSALSVSCHLNGSKSSTNFHESSFDEKLYGNILFGGPIGAAIDAETGAGFNYPKRIISLIDCK